MTDDDKNDDLGDVVKEETHRGRRGVLDTEAQRRRQERARALLGKARECAEVGDERAFRQVLVEEGLVEGTAQFEEGLSRFRDLCHALRRRGPA